MHLRSKYYHLIYENASLRRILSGKTEVLRMIYGAVRDPNWGTLTPQIISESVVPGTDGFEIRTSLLYEAPPIRFRADYYILGQGAELLVEMKGEALSDFKSCRIGLCVLHPIKECAGKACLLEHSNGTKEESRFPDQIAAHQPMFDIAALHWQASGSLEASLRFSGEVFEMEDQRNWTDASYKTYGRPLALPFPFKVRKGDRVEQSVKLKLHSEPAEKPGPEALIFHVDKDRTFPVPEFGACLPDRQEPLLPGEARLLEALPLQHLRMELKLYQEHWEPDLNRAIRETNPLPWSLFLVLYVSENWEKEVEACRALLGSRAEQVHHLLLLGPDHLSEDPVFDVACDTLRSAFVHARVGAGVNANFAELNRNLPASLKPDFISFSISPQLHAFDQKTLVENLEAQSYVLQSARQLFPDKLLYVSPVSLKPRLNVVATTDETPASSGQLPAHVDRRQNSIFAAQWLLGSLKYLAQSGAELVTLFETLGWAGFIQGDYPPPRPELFSSRAGDLFPVYTLLKEFTGFEQMLYSRSSAPLTFEGVVLSENQKPVKMLLTHFSGSPQTIALPDLGHWSSARSLFLQKEIKISPEGVRLPPNEVVVFT